MAEYNHNKIERKWQKEWEKKKIYAAKDTSKKKKFYGLIEFPYPSGAGMHVGHIRSNTAMDIISRKRRMEGRNVLYPIGWDAFGLPTENYAIKTGIHPIQVTKQNTDTFRRQLKSLGFSFDWSREINTTDPKYYKWTQWIFLQFFKKGLAYKKKTEINWCPKDKIGLANEEVVNGCCERCGTPVEKREKEQWMLAITKYAERLDKDLDLVDYLPKIKIQQRNWIGKSEGAEINFKIQTYPLTPSQREGELGYHTTDPKTWRVLQDRVLEMRSNPTQAEDKLWQALKSNLTGFHFRRQHIIDRFVVDFVCLSKNLVIEVDGDIHDYQQERDKERTDILEALGLKIIRFKNEEVLHNLSKVVKKIENELKALPFGEGLGEVRVFTTRADTLFGVTYLVLAPEHELVQKLKPQITNWKEVEKYILNLKNKTEIERTAEDKVKTGVELKGVKAVNPGNGEEIPIWIADYVLASYGTGAVMAVPTHDERDFAFAKKYGLPIKQVVIPDILDAKNPPREDKKNTERDTVHVILRNTKEKKVLVLFLKDEKWKGLNPKSFIIGGIEEGETDVQAAEREIKEETGYTDFKFVEKIPFQIQARFFAAHKDVNRKIHVTTLVFDLMGDNKIDITEDKFFTKDSHEFHWVPYEKVAETITIGDDQMSWKYFHSGGFAYVADGILINSGKFDDLDSDQAKKAIIKFVGGKEKTTFKLRDWVFSRQRYWGEPIPLIDCPKCGFVPVPEKNLPVKLPMVKNYQPTDTGESPLAAIKSWVNVKCPKCKGKAKRETDTMPNWAGSSWYFLRYTDPKNKKEFAGKKNLKYWLGSPKRSGGGAGGVDWYNGGMEHTTLHLLYSRFWHKFLYDLKLVPTTEPYAKRTSHGMILAESGDKMSKSRGNVVNPDDLVKTFGADTLRLYEMFMGPFDQAVAWNTDSMIGPRRFLERVWNLQTKVKANKNVAGGRFTPPAEGKPKDFYLPLLDKTIKKVSADIEAMHFNTAVSALMILVNEMGKIEYISQSAYEKFLQILAPFAPHITEEIWHNLGHKNSIHLSAWPQWDKDSIKDEEIKIAVQVGGKVRAEILVSADGPEEEIKQQALSDETVLKYTAGQEIKKIIYVKGRLVNIVL